MTPEERARIATAKIEQQCHDTDCTVKDMLASVECEANGCRAAIAVIADAIRAAENDALERANDLVLAGASVYGLASDLAFIEEVTAAIRALKHPVSE